MSPTEQGSLLARTLAGSWRPVPPPLRLSSDELAAVTPLLMETGGAGLGLTIARSIVQVHGGTLSLQSTSGAGSEFTIRLPLAAG